MANQAIWIGVAVGVFFAGLGIGYAVFPTSTPVMGPGNSQQMMAQMMTDPQAMNDWMNQMMVNPQAMQKMHDTMMNNPQAMNSWMDMMMNNPNAMQQMHSMMANNPQHMQTMINTMGPNMMGPMMQNQQFMHGMMMDPQFQQNWMGPWMSNSTNWNRMMGSGWMNQGMMGPGMMGSGMMMGPMMMGTPITKQADIIKTVDKIEDLLDQVSTKYNEGDSVGALSTATEAYLENYEYIEGAVAEKDQNLMQKVELMLRRDLRHAINTNQPAEEIDSQIDSIKEELAKIRDLF